MEIAGKPITTEQEMDEAIQEIARNATTAALRKIDAVFHCKTGPLGDSLAYALDETIRKAIRAHLEA